MAKRLKNSTHQPAPAGSQLSINSVVVVAVVSLLASLGIYWWASTTYNSGLLRTLRLEQAFGTAALVSMFCAMFAAPIKQLAQRRKIEQKLYEARRSLAIAAVYFAVLHAWMAIVGELGGFQGISFLSRGNLAILVAGLAALIIFLVSAFTTFNGGLPWRLLRSRTWLHRAVFLLSGLTAVNLITYAANFGNFDVAIIKISYVLTAVWLLLEAPRLVRLWQTGTGSKVSPAIPIVLLCFIFLALGYSFEDVTNRTQNASHKHSSATGTTTSAPSGHNHGAAVTKDELDQSKLYVYAGTSLFKTDRLIYDIGTFTTAQQPFVIHIQDFHGTPLTATAMSGVMVDVATHEALFLQGVINGGTADMQPISSMGVLKPGKYSVFLSGTVAEDDSKLTATMNIQIK